MSLTAQQWLDLYNKMKNEGENVNSFYLNEILGISQGTCETDTKCVGSFDAATGIFDYDQDAEEHCFPKQNELQRAEFGVYQIPDEIIGKIAVLLEDQLNYVLQLMEDLSHPIPLPKAELYKVVEANFQIFLNIAMTSKFEVLIEVPVIGSQKPVLLTPVKDTNLQNRTSNVIPLHQIGKAFTLSVHPKILNDPNALFELIINGFNARFFFSLPKRVYIDRSIKVITIRLGSKENIVRPDIHPLFPEPIYHPCYSVAGTRALGIFLKFRVRNNESTVYLRIYGRWIENVLGESVQLEPTEIWGSADQNEDEIKVWIGPATAIAWQIFCEQKSANGTIYIKRPHKLCCFGVLSQPVLPIAIVYDPPQPTPDPNPDPNGPEKYNSCTYCRTRTLQVIYGTEVTNEEQQKSTSSKYGDLEGIRDGLNTVIPFLKDVPVLGTILKGVKLFFDTLLGGTGETTTTTVEGSSITSKGELAFLWSQERDIVAEQHLGPGLGDIFYILKGSYFGWFGIEGEPQNARLIFLGGPHGDIQIEAGPAAWQLLADLDVIREGRESFYSGLRKESIEQLLALDPFVNNPTLKLDDNPRFKLQGYIEPGGSIFKTKLSFSSQDRDETIKEHFKTITTDHQAGLLGSVLGDKSSHITVTHKIGSSYGTNEETTLTLKPYFVPDNLNPYGIKIFEDQVFGTLAFTRELIYRPDTPRLSGQVVDKKGRPQVNKVVKLVSAGVTYWTTTNEKGEYKFSSQMIKPGRALIQIETISKQIQLDSFPMKGVKMQLK